MRVPFKALALACPGSPLSRAPVHSYQQRTWCQLAPPEQLLIGHT